MFFCASRFAQLLTPEIVFTETELGTQNMINTIESPLSDEELLDAYEMLRSA